MNERGTVDSWSARADAVRAAGRIHKRGWPPQSADG